MIAESLWDISASGGALLGTSEKYAYAVGRVRGWLEARLLARANNRRNDYSPDVMALPKILEEPVMLTLRVR